MKYLSIVFTVLILLKYNQLVIQPATLINYWPMSNLSDVVGRANLFGGYKYSFVPDRFCSPNSSIYFNIGYLQVPAGIYFSGDFTVTAWINLKSYQYNARILDFSNGGTNSDTIILYMSGSSSIMLSSAVYQGTNGTIVRWFTSTIVIKLNQWYFVAFVLQNTTSYMYVNGSLAATASLLIPNNITRTLNYFGRPSPSAPDAIFDEIKIYQGALSANDILTEFNTNLYSINSEIIMNVCPNITSTTTTSTTPTTTTIPTTTTSTTSTTTSTTTIKTPPISTLTNSTRINTTLTMTSNASLFDQISNNSNNLQQTTNFVTLIATQFLNITNLVNSYF